QAETKGAANTAPAFAGRINELHYDNDGGDVGEFIEIRTDAGTDVSGATVELLNGNGGVVYNTLDLPSATMTSDGTFDYYVFNLPTNGLQNGSPDGLALINNGSVVEFLSYEGTFTASAGTAVGLTSTDIGVAEGGGTQIGESLQRWDGEMWDAPRAETKGFDNASTVPLNARINEIHYDNVGGDVGEFVEVRTDAGADASLITLEFVNGNDGGVYTTLSLADATSTSDGTFDYYVFDLRPNGLQNGPDGIALANDGALVEFLSYEGSFTAINGVAAGVTSTDIGVAESASTPIGLSVQRLDGDMWDAPRAETKGADNTPPPAPTLISAIQGSGSESPLLGSAVTVSAVVTGLVNNGFFVQEEAADSDGDASTSEGIFVFTGGAPTVVAGDQVTLSGTVEEFFGETQIGGTMILSQATGGIIPTPTLIELSPLGTDFEAVEGMLVEVTSGVAGVNLEVIENFNLDRFGEITISAGRQTQPTQIFDPQDQAAEVAQLAQENLNNRLGIDDGVGGSNPDAFAYLPSNVGDNGNGILDAGDTFTADGQTVRLGAELTNNPIGIMRFNFGEYKLSAQNTLEFDESTNNDARPDTPPVVDGALKVGSFNVLNYFTTLDTSANQNSVGPNNLDPRGAETADQLQRQTDKLVDAILATGASAFALQELENNGFGTDGSPSAIGALVGAINAELISQGQAGTYAFVDPTGGDPAG
ncbi:MAG: hypothetical protein AAGA78_06920, partial [Pseudomonadota bacterium]